MKPAPLIAAVIARSALVAAAEQRCF